MQDLLSSISLFLTFVGVSVLFNFLFLRWTRTLGAKNMIENQPRWSDNYKPAIGGVSFYILFLISFVFYIFFFVPELNRLNPQHMGVLLIVSIGFFAGLADDAFNTVPWLKLAAQILCGVLMVFFGIQINFFDIPTLDALLTVFWTVAVMNSINMLDNMDGITATVSVFILIAAGLSSIPMDNVNLFYTFICTGVAAALVGFLFFNWNPSKMFMGDTGSQLLGALLAIVGVLFFWNNENIAVNHTWWSKISIVMTAFCIPIGDTLTVSINRIARGQSPFVGGRDHTTHHLSYAGLSDRQIAMLYMAISALSTALIGWLAFLPIEETTWYYAVLFLFSGSCIAFLYSTTQWKKTKAIFRKKHLPTQ